MILLALAGYIVAGLLVAALYAWREQNADEAPLAGLFWPMTLVGLLLDRPLHYLAIALENIAEHRWPKDWK